jgi:hypothetical protein
VKKPPTPREVLADLTELGRLIREDPADDPDRDAKLTVLRDLWRTTNAGQRPSTTHLLALAATLRNEQARVTAHRLLDRLTG